MAKDSADLSPAELRVLRLVARGFTSKQIGAKLKIKPHTASHYLFVIGKRWDVKGKAAVLLYADEHGKLIKRKIRIPAVPESEWLKRAEKAGFRLHSRPEFPGDKRAAFRDRRKKDRRK